MPSGSASGFEGTGTDEPLFTDVHRGKQPDGAGAVLRRVPLGARHQVRVVHSSVVRAQRRRHERGESPDQRRAPGRNGCACAIFSRLETGARSSRAAGQGVSEVFRSYGSRSYLYAEMAFGNTFIVRNLMASTTPAPIYAMRTPRAISMAEILSRTQLSADEVRLFNPTLVDRVPAGATLYLPFQVSEFGLDVAFWRRDANPAYATVLDDFMRLEPGPERWDDRASRRSCRTFGAGSAKRTRKRGQ